MIMLQDIFPDKAMERKILSLAVKCPSDGCEWTGELRYKEVKLSRYSLYRINHVVVKLGTYTGFKTHKMYVDILLKAS